MVVDEIEIEQETCLHGWSYHPPSWLFRLYSKYPWRIEPLKLVFWGLAVIGAATNFGALSVSSLQNDQNTKSVTSLLLQSSGSLRNIICFYCPLSCLKWIYIIYELKMYAVWWSVNESIPQSFSMNRVLCRYSLTILSILKSAVLCKQWCVRLHC